MNGRPRPLRALQNSRLLAESAIQHLLDDPALLLIQISRRLPMNFRRRAGMALDSIPSRFPGALGVQALGAVMCGRSAAAEERVAGASDSAQQLGRLGGEVAILLDRPDLVQQSAASTTRARAAWARGDVSGAIRILESDGRGRSRYARRLRSERRLLETGQRIDVESDHGTDRLPGPSAFQPPVDGESLRVLHLLTNSLPHTQSGYSLRSHRILTALKDHGIESLVLTRTGYPVLVGKPLARVEDDVDGIRYRRTLPGSLGSLPEDRLAREVDETLVLVRTFRPHVLHATTDYRNALVAQEVSRRTGIPWIFEVRGLMEKTWIASHRSPSERNIAAASERARLIAAREGELARAAAAVVTLGGAMENELVARGVVKSAITLVPNGIDESLLSRRADPEEARSRAGLEVPASAFVVGAASALVDYEGFDVLLRAAARIIDGDTLLASRLHVVLAGDGAAAPGLAALAAEMGIADRVHMPGRVPRGQALDWVQALDVVVVPRRDLEVTRAVTPQKPVEAMALGRPVVVSDLPALRETVTGEDGAACAEVFPAGDDRSLAELIVELACDSARRTHLAVHGQEVAATRRWSELMRRYDAVYRRVIGEAVKGASNGE